VPASESSLDRLWDATAPSGERYAPDHLCGLTLAAQRYLRRAIAPGTPRVAKQGEFIRVLVTSAAFR
jgi:hypothetical protein